MNDDEFDDPYTLIACPICTQKVGFIDTRFIIESYVCVCEDCFKKIDPKS